MISKSRIAFVLGLLLMVHCISCTNLPLMSTKKDEARDSLWPVCSRLKEQEFIDLTHAFGTDIPRWKGYPQ